MFQHDITHDKYYVNGEATTKEEYETQLADWQESLPEPVLIPYDEQEAPDSEALSAILGGAS